MQKFSAITLVVAAGAVLSACAGMSTGDGMGQAMAFSQAALPDAAERGIDPAGPGSRDIFLAVLGSPLFLHREIGPLDLHDPETAIVLGAAYLGELDRRFGGDLRGGAGRPGRAGAPA